VESALPKPVLAYDTDEPEFARGFEAGRLWALLRESPKSELREYLRDTNVEMVMRIAEATGRRAQSRELGDGWLLVRFEAAPES
jgi:hypothetical protein